MSETETIPADVREAAFQALGTGDDDVGDIVLAILAERERCATVAETHTNASGLYIASMIREGAP